jgi:hypothetical protein
MNRLKPWVFFGLVLSLSVAFGGFGVWLAYDSMHHMNRDELRTGILILCPGAIVLSVVLGVLVNQFFPSERQRLQESLRRNRPSAISYRIKKMERNLRHLHFMKRHPSVVFLFCIAALIFLTGMALAPASCFTGQNINQIHVAHALGFVFGSAYVVILLLFLYALLTKRWEPYMDASIAKLEAQLTQAKAENKTDPSTSSG